MLCCGYFIPSNKGGQAPREGEMLHPPIAQMACTNEFMANKATTQKPSSQMNTIVMVVNLIATHAASLAISQQE